MKTIFTSFILLAISACSISLAATNNDNDFSKYLIGKWKHLSSTLPDGTVLTYQREIEFSSDGTGICRRFSVIDTVETSFNWEIKNQVIYLFVFSKRGKRIDADAQQISSINTGKLILKDVYGEEQTGKICAYQKTDAAKF